MSIKFREVKCHMCEHIFMWQERNDADYEYRIDNVSGTFQSATCPKCGKENIVLPGELVGVSTKSDNVHRFGIHGI